MKKVLLYLLIVNSAYGQVIVTSKHDKRLISYNDSVSAYKENNNNWKKFSGLFKKVKTRDQFFHLKDSLGFDDCDCCGHGMATYKDGKMYKHGYRYRLVTSMSWNSNLYECPDDVGEAWYKVVPYPKVKVIYKSIETVTERDKNLKVLWYTNDRLDSTKDYKEKVRVGKITKK